MTTRKTKTKNAKRQTNVECVKHLMEFSAYGPLAQLWVLDALTKWADVCIDAGPDKFESPMFNGKSWVGVAKEIKDKIDAHLAS